MIVKALFELVFVLLEVAFYAIDLPDLPEEFNQVIEQLFNAMESGLGILSVFIDWENVLVLVPIVIIIANFDKAWNLIMFILRKIPFLGIK